MLLMALKVLVLLPLSPAQRQRLEAAAPGANFVYVADDAAAGAGLSLGALATDGQISAADIIVGNLPCDRLNVARNLKLLQLNSAGYDNYLAAGVLPEGAVLASAVGAYGQAVSEHLFAMLFSLMKRLPAYRDAQREHTWTDFGPVTTLRDAQVLVLGCGDIGSHFAQLCQAMGAHVTGVRRHTGAAPEGFEAVRTMDELPNLLGKADAVASFLPSAPSTRKLANDAFFAAMKPGSYFANGGRGNLVDNDALVAALNSGHLAGAALDVTDPEPLPVESPLWDAPNVFITPHISGGFHLPAVLDNVVSIAAENIRYLQAGESIRNNVSR